MPATERLPPSWCRSYAASLIPSAPIRRVSVHQDAAHSASAAGGPCRLEEFGRSSAISCNHGIHNFTAKETYEPGGAPLRSPVAQFKGVHETATALAFHMTSLFFVLASRKAGYVSLPLAAIGPGVDPRERLYRQGGSLSTASGGKVLGRSLVRGGEIPTLRPPAGPCYSADKASARLR